MKSLRYTGAPPVSTSRRTFVLGAASACALGALSPQSWSAPFATSGSRSEPPVIRDHQLDLVVGYKPVNFTGRPGFATTINQSLPAPILRWREGEEVRVRVRNDLDEDTSIHWHGIILPSEMDGVPGLSFAGIKPSETFEYKFRLRQSGTYWYHSHSHFQEQVGLYGALIIDPAGPDPVRCDRDLVLLLSDWSDTPPARIYATLKKQSHYYNRRERTVGDLWSDLRQRGLRATTEDRAMWNRMRMSDRDLADVTGYTYTYLMNGVTPDRGWTGHFEPGERVRLRIINGSAMTLFDVRIPGLKMTVVAADGQNIKPVEVDEFRIGVAETYDVIVEPAADKAYTIFAQTSDRSGYARGTLTPNVAWSAEIPSMDPAPVLSHADMGMGHGDHGTSSRVSGDHSAHVPTQAPAQSPSLHQADAHDHSAHANHAVSAGDKSHLGHHATNQGGHADHGAHTDHRDHTDHVSVPSAGHHAGHADHSAHGDHADHSAPHAHLTHKEISSAALAPAGFGANFGASGPVWHRATEFGPQVDMRVANPVSGIADPGIGLRDRQQVHGRRVLTYADLRALHPTRDERQPTREIELHLTGNMHRYMWSVDGVRHADAPPIVLQYGERVRFILVNDTMMTHPFHLHGLWSELETGDPEFIPRKHTVLVQPGSKISYLVTADAKGRWAYHCHMLYHMAGMMREVRVI